MKVLLTRNAAANRKTANRLRRLGHDPVSLALSRVVATHAPIPKRHPHAIILTSANALAGVDDTDLKRLAGLPVFAVGKQTAAAARRAGFANVVAGAGDASALASDIRAKCEERGMKHLLYLAGETRSYDMVSALKPSGMDVELVETYRIEPADPGKTRMEKAILNTSGGAHFHYSAASATRFLELALKYGLLEHLSNCAAVAISRQVVQVPGMRAYGSLRIAKTPDEAAMIGLL